WRRRWSSKRRRPSSLTCSGRQLTTSQRTLLPTFRQSSVTTANGTLTMPSRSGTTHAEGKAEVFKERVEFDEQKKIVKLNGLEGDVMKIYKVYNPIFELVSSESGGGGGVAKLAIEYEKLDPSFPAPTKYMDFMINLTKETDAGLVKSG
ncbi:MLP-like protein 328, partial [Linum perenne]